MMSRAQQLLVIITLLVMGACLGVQAQERWVFEGLITESDPSLAPQLQSGWVLSGSFLLNSLEMEEQYVHEETRSGRMAGGITEAEMTVDLYYQVLFQAAQQQGLAGFDFQDNNPEENGRDLFGWFFPLKGALEESGWTSTWLQIWLMDPEGKMINYTPVKISPYGIEWKSGWFRLTFTNDDGETAYADGRIELFCPESKADESDNSPWYAATAELSRQLMERDSTINLLQKELSELKSRLDGLRRMVDLLVEERSSLQEDNELLRKRAEAADPEIISKLAEITAEKALMESRITDLSGENDSLQVKLSKSEQERYQLLQELAELDKKYQGQDSPVAAEQPVAGPIESTVPESALLPPVPEPEASGSPVELQRDVEAMKKVESPQIPSPKVPAIDTPVVEKSIQPVPVEPEQEYKRSTRKWGPRKFR